MLVLALDTATSDLVVQVARDGRLLQESIVADTRGHNEVLMPTVMDTVAAAGASLAEVEAIVVGEGPGPFTGLRVGLATAQALGQSLGVPVHGVSSLDAIAVHSSAHNVLVATDARRKEIYWASYSGGQRTAGPEVIKPEDLELPHPVEEIIIPAHLADRLPEGIGGVDKQWWPPRGLVEVADFSAAPTPLEPAYLRRPDAVAPKPVPRSPAIPEVEL